MGCNARKITNIYIYIYIQFIYSRKHKIIWTWENINHKIYYNIWSNLLFSHLRVLLNISRAVYILVLALCSLGWKNPLGYGAPLITLRFRQVSLITLWYIRWAFSELSYMCRGRTPSHQPGSIPNSLRKCCLENSIAWSSKPLDV